MAITGKSREICTAALRAAGGDPNIAFEFAMAGGVPAGMEEGDEEDYGSEDPNMSAANDPFLALAANPNFAMIRQRILQDPNFY